MKGRLDLIRAMQIFTDAGNDVESKVQLDLQKQMERCS